MEVIRVFVVVGRMGMMTVSNIYWAIVIYKATLHTLPSSQSIFQTEKSESYCRSAMEKIEPQRTEASPTVTQTIKA